MNPFEVLDVAPDASERRIMEATRRAMAERRFDIRTIHEARRQLLDPVGRHVYRFLATLGVAERSSSKVDVPDARSRPSSLEYDNPFEDTL